MTNPFEGIGGPRVVRVDLGKSSVNALLVGVTLLLAARCIGWFERRWRVLPGT